MKLLNWFKKLIAVVNSYDADLRAAHVHIADLEKLVRDRTTISVDVGLHGCSHVIVMGRYRNTDFVQTYEVRHDELGKLIDHLQRASHYGVVRRVDAPPQIRAAFERL
jgi:hypothetical protein